MNQDKTGNKEENNDDYYDIIIIGAGPAGMTAAINARTYYPKKTILVVRNVSQGVVPCAIPYMFTELKTPEENLIQCGQAKDLKINILNSEVVNVNKKKKIIETTQKNVNYKKLVLALGSKALVPPIKNINKKGIYPIHKDFSKLSCLKDEFSKAKNIVVAGGSFIGCEFADELANLKDKKITVVELLPRVLSTFDEEFSKLGFEELKNKGINIITNNGIKSFECSEGSDRVNKIILNNDEELCADLVILGLGARPQTSLAKKIGLKLTSRSFIKVNKKMITSDKNIFAIGDCASKKFLLDGEDSGIMLASIAAREARIAASNLFSSKKNSLVDRGIIGSYSTKINNLVLASTGYTEEQLKKNDESYLKSFIEVPDRHPGKMPDASIIRLKLLFNKKRVLVGAQVAGGESAGELINLLSLAIEHSLKVEDLYSMQIASHPKLTSSPVTYPVMMAAQKLL